MPDATSALSRRECLRVGLAGFGALSLPALLRFRAGAAGRNDRERTAVILVWLRGGASHLETYDPKTEAPAEYRGPNSAIATRTPGMRICELLPQHAKVSDRFTLVRSLAHTGGGHPAGSLQMLSGDPDAQDKLKPVFPDFMSITSHQRAAPGRKLPVYVGVNPVVRYDNFTIAGPAYLGPTYEPFSVLGDPSAPNFRVPNVGTQSAETTRRLRERTTLKHRFDGMRRDIDQSGAVKAMDRFEEQALSLLTGPEAARAFDLDREGDRVRDRYGRNAWGQQLLMARRLVEAGVDVVTSTLDGPLCGRVGNWDDHAVNHNIFDAMKFRAPFFDQAVSALIEDLYARGLDRRVLLVVTGEFGRTPRISNVASSGGGVASAATGIVQPGRDHWPRAGSMLWAGGGMRTGRIIGATDRRGEDVVERKVGPQDFLATLYSHLGIDYTKVAIPDYSGRPIPIVRDGAAIAELSAGE